MKTKVIYIVGSAHSGSTLLDLILGSHSQIASVGEVNERVAQILSGEVARLNWIDQTCTCGRRFVDCPYWVPVIDHIRRQGAQQEFMRNPSSAIRDNRIFIEEVLRQSRKQAYAESTKSIDRLMKLREDDGFDVYALHIVRDVRAVVYSNMRKGRAVSTYVRRWKSKNRALLDLRGAFPARWMTLKYEALATSPREEVQRIMRFVGEPFEEAQLDYSNAAHHILEGNRLRFDRRSEITADTRYLSEMGAYQWAAVTIRAAGLLRQLGYPLSRRDARALFHSHPIEGAIAYAPGLATTPRS